MSKLVEATVLSSTPNAAVVKLAARRYPGILVQGDSMRNLLTLVQELQSNIEPDSEAADTAKEVAEILRSYLLGYEATLKEHGLDLPYTDPVSG